MREGGPGESGITSLPRMAHGLSPVMFPTAVWLDLIILILQEREQRIKGEK